MDTMINPNGNPQECIADGEGTILYPKRSEAVVLWLHFVCPLYSDLQLYFTLALPLLTF